MKYKEGEHIYLYWEDNDHPEYVRGHVTAEQARNALEKSIGDIPDGELKIAHKYGRFGFSGNSDFDHELYVYDKPQRGAFALTEVS